MSDNVRRRLRETCLANPQTLLKSYVLIFAEDRLILPVAIPDPLGWRFYHVSRVVDETQDPFRFTTPRGSHYYGCERRTTFQHQMTCIAFISNTSINRHITCDGGSCGRTPALKPRPPEYSAVVERVQTSFLNFHGLEDVVYGSKCSETTVCRFV